jgi:hypothetical protein
MNIYFQLNSRQGCVEDFSTLGRTAYTLYLTMVNMQDYTQFNVYFPMALYLHHVYCVVTVGILLVNLLVAIFFDTMSNVILQLYF